MKTLLFLLFLMLTFSQAYCILTNEKQDLFAYQISNEYDVRSVTIYDTSNSSLPSNMINCIALEGNTNKWIGTDNGLVKYDGNSWTIYNTVNSGISGNNITQITIDTSGLKWIYSTDGGLVAFDDIQWTSHNEITGVYSLKADTQGNVWVGKSSELSEFSHGGWLHYLTSNSGVPHSNINAIAFDFLGYKWLGSESTGLVRFDGNNWITYNQTNTNQPINSIRSLYYDFQYNLWIGTIDHAVVMYDAGNWTAYQSSNSPFADDASITCISQGNIQAVWFGTSNQGLIKRSGTQWTVFSGSNLTFPTNEIRALAVDNLDVKWVGTSMGLVKLDNIVPIGPGEPIPTPSMHLNCFPNPFNPSTTLEYDLPNAEYVELDVYNIKGQIVRKLVDEYQSTGHHQITWNGLDQLGNDVSSGMYLCKLKAGMKQVTRKVMLLK